MHRKFLFRLYSGGTFNGISSTSWRRWGRSIGLYDRTSWYAASGNLNKFESVSLENWNFTRKVDQKNLATSGPVKARSKFHKFPWVPPLLHSDHNARRFDSFEWGALPTWKAKRPSRIKRLGSGAQRMRRLTFYRFSQTMPSMGTFWKNDSCTGNHTINWPKI